MNYVMSDIHGQGKKFINMLKLINFTDNDTLYILGDVIDRGMDSIPLLRYVMSKKNIVMTLGNHEDFLIKSYDENLCIENVEYVNKYIECLNSGENIYKYNINYLFNMANWLNNGGLITAYQFLKLNEIEQLETINYIKNLPLYIELDKYILVHAGINCYRSFNFWDNVKNYQTKEDLIWDRYFMKSSGLADKITIFGHTHTKSFTGKWEIWGDNNKIDIDCGAAYGGKLACLCLDNLEQYYV